MRLRRWIALTVLAMLAAAAVGAPTASARRLDRQVAVERFPLVAPFGKLRKRERVLWVSVRTEADEMMSGDLEVICLDRHLRPHRRRSRKIAGMGHLRLRLRVPRVRRGRCYGAATFRISSRRADDTAPVRLSAALYAARR
jgi:hypothetical protein